MSKELVASQYCYAGDPENKEKRIWLGCFNELHLCVLPNYETKFKNGEYYEAYSWEQCTPIEDEPEYYYIWERVEAGYIRCSYYLTDKYAKVHNYTTDSSWIRNDSTKRLPLGVKE